MKGARVLSVQGRKTGEWQSTPVNALSTAGQRYLVAPRWETQWVRNIRVSREDGSRWAAGLKPCTWWKFRTGRRRPSSAPISMAGWSAVILRPLLSVFRRRSRRSARWRRCSPRCPSAARTTPFPARASSTRRPWLRAAPLAGRHTGSDSAGARSRVASGLPDGSHRLRAHVLLVADAHGGVAAAARVGGGAGRCRDEGARARRPLSAGGAVGARRSRMRLHVRLSVGDARRPPASAGGAGAVAAALRGPAHLLHRLRGARGQRVSHAGGHLRQPPRVLDRALALGLQRRALSPACLPPARPADVLFEGAGAAASSAPCDRRRPRRTGRRGTGRRLRARFAAAPRRREGSACARRRLDGGGAERAAGGLAGRRRDDARAADRRAACRPHGAGAG